MGVCLRAVFSPEVEEKILTVLSKNCFGRLPLKAPLVRPEWTQIKCPYIKDKLMPSVRLEEIDLLAVE